MQLIERGFMEGSDAGREVMMIAEEISSIPPAQRAALREYIKALAHTDKDSNDKQTGTS